MEITNSCVLNNIEKYSSYYSQAKPFPHIILDDMWNEKFLSLISNEFVDFSNWEGQKQFFGSTNKSFCSKQDLLPYNVNCLIDFCNSSAFIKFLINLTGINSLNPDPFLLGGGMHSTSYEGFLKMHVDFNWHEKLKMFRRVNVLIYLNKDWRPNWNGQLWYGTKNERNVVLPKKMIDIRFNRTVIFNTNKYSWHGHPQPLKCPINIRRNSIALYYYTEVDWDYSNSLQREYTVYVKDK